MYCNKFTQQYSAQVFENIIYLCGLRISKYSTASLKIVAVFYKLLLMVFIVRYCGSFHLMAKLTKMYKRTSGTQLTSSCTSNYHQRMKTLCCQLF